MAIGFFYWTYQILYLYPTHNLHLINSDTIKQKKKKQKSHFYKVFQIKIFVQQAFVHLKLSSGYNAEDSERVINKLKEKSQSEIKSQFSIVEENEEIFP